MHHYILRRYCDDNQYNRINSSSTGHTTKIVLPVEDELVRFPDDEMDVIKFRNNTMVCGCTRKITLIYGVIKLNFGITLKYYIDCVCDLLQILTTCGCDLFNYTEIKLVTYTACMCLNRSCTQYVCDQYKKQ